MLLLLATQAMTAGAIASNFDAAINMVEGAVVDGTGRSFYGALTHKDGVPEQKMISIIIA